MAIDVEALLAPLSEESPAGPDLSYDSERQEIETAFDSSISDDGASGSDVDWRKTTNLILAQAEKTRDIWLPVYLMRAGAKSGDFATLEAGAELLAGLLEQQWDTIHPQLDELGYQGRKGPCESLTRIAEFIGPLRKVILIEHPRLGSYGAADFERFNDNGDSEDGYGMFRAALEETSDDDLNAVIARVDALEAAVRRADSVLTEKAEGDTGTNFQPTYEALQQMRRSISAFLRTPPESSSEDGASDDGWSNADSSSESSGGGSGRIESREDVIRTIDAIAAYYARKEPGSPVPVILRRARDWVGMDFLAVLEDIAPGSVDEAKRVLVSGQQQNGGYSDGWSSDSE